LDNLKKAQGMVNDDLPPPAPHNPNQQVNTMERDPNRPPPPQGVDPNAHQQP